MPEKSSDIPFATTNLLCTSSCKCIHVPLSVLLSPTAVLWPCMIAIRPVFRLQLSFT